MNRNILEVSFNKTCYFKKHFAVLLIMVEFIKYLLIDLIVKIITFYCRKSILTRLFSTYFSNIQQVLECINVKVKNEKNKIPTVQQKDILYRFQPYIDKMNVFYCYKKNNLEYESLNMFDLKIKCFQYSIYSRNHN